MDQTGGCNCGSIRYQLLDEPLFTHICHCTECQRDSGGAFNMTVLVLEGEFKILEGEPLFRVVTRKSGNQYKSYFCHQCGCPLYGMPIESTGIMVLRPGSLDNTSWINPQAHIWACEKQNWLPLPDTIPVFEKDYELKDTWPKSSLEKINNI